MLWCKLKTLTVLTWDLAGFIFFYKDKIKIFAHHHLWLFHLDALEGIKINEKFLFPKQHFQEKNKKIEQIQLLFKLADNSLKVFFFFFEMKPFEDISLVATIGWKPLVVWVFETHFRWWNEAIFVRNVSRNDAFPKVQSKPLVKETMQQKFMKF